MFNIGFEFKMNICELSNGKWTIPEGTKSRIIDKYKNDEYGTMYLVIFEGYGDHEISETILKEISEVIPEDGRQELLKLK